MHQGTEAATPERPEQAALRAAWEAVPQGGGTKGLIVDEHKETPGVLAITSDGRLILHRTRFDDFALVSTAEASGWRIAPYNETQDVQFCWVTELLA